MSGGAFITFEGSDGSGKTTQLRLLQRRLEEAGRDPVATFEPGGTEGAEAIGRLLLEGSADRWSPASETLLFTAARRDHVERLIRPALDAGRIVLSDRFHDSTAVYQAAGGGDPEMIDTLHGLAIGLVPDLTLVLRISVEESSRRRQARGGSQHRYERVGADFDRRVEEGYAALCSRYPARCVAIDGDAPIEEIAENVWNSVQQALP